jgi:hypothetical protein
MQSLKEKIEEAEGLRSELKALTEAVEPVANLFEPRVAGVQPCPLVERLKDTQRRFWSMLKGWLAQFQIKS